MTKLGFKSRVCHQFPCAVWTDAWIPQQQGLRNSPCSHPLHGHRDFYSEFHEDHLAPKHTSISVLAKRQTTDEAVAAKWTDSWSTKHPCKQAARWQTSSLPWSLLIRWRCESLEILYFSAQMGVYFHYIMFTHKHTRRGKSNQTKTFCKNKDGYTYPFLLCRNKDN